MRPTTSAAAVLLAVALAACSKGDAPAAPAVAASRAYRVTVAAVEPKPLVYSVNAVGSLEARQVVTVPARVEGMLDRLDFDEGSAVTPETVLAVIDERRYSLVVDLAKAAVREAEATAKQSDAAVASAAARTARVNAELEEARANLARWTALRAKDPGFVTEEKLLGLEASAKSLAASLDEAKAGEAEAAARTRELTATIEARHAAVAIAEKNVADTRVRSPIAGVVEKRQVGAGQYVKVGDPIATLIDTSSLRLRFSVGETESVRLTNDQTVSFSVRAFPAKTFHAKLFHMDSTADPTTRMVECLATVTDADAALRPGFFAEVNVEISRSDAAILVPEGALLATEQGFVGYVVEKGRAVRRPFVIGLHTKDGGVEVLSGLAAGESLVIRGAQSLVPGVPVEIVTEAAKQ
jgi:membrane fusion protein (multidrug efflux system)